MSKISFIMSYELVYKGDTHFYRGNIYSEGDGKCDNELFNELSFTRMMTRLAKAVRSVSQVGEVVLRRSEVENSSVKLGADEIKLIKTNPAAWIRSMIVPDRVMVVGDKKSSSILRVGHDTLANAFGENIYLSRREDRKVECLGCGRWVAQFGKSNHGSRDAIRCQLCGVYLEGKIEGAWFVTTMSDVLSSEMYKRFFLPRGWNETGPWISREDLRKRYEDFLEERDHVQ